MQPAGKLHALAATARIANAPSVAGNVFLGLAIARWTGNRGSSGGFPPEALLPVVTGIGLYFAGNFLNDWADRDWDASRRPERALPRGLFSPNVYLSVASGWGLLALCTAASRGLQCLVVALTIGVCILVYTRVHKRAVWSVIPMGLCRALLPALGFSGLSGSDGFPSALAWCAAGLFCHIVGLSLSARCEAMRPPPTGLLRFARLWFPPAALSMSFAAWQSLSLPLATSLAGVLPYTLWTVLCLTVFRKPVPVHVSNLLAGIPLVDWIVLLPLALALAMQGPFPVACMVIPPMAFVTGKALQRLTPAT